MLFLATPNNGASSAQLLKRILQASHSGSHHYLDDLQKDSPAIQEINDEFRHCAGNLQLYSFFETKAMNFGKFTDITIVKKTSAVMGLPGERTAHLDADHRGVCKFDSAEDPNFITVRNAFVEVLDGIRIHRRSETINNVAGTDSAGQLNQKEEARNQKKQLKAFLYITDLVQSDALEFQHEKIAGSCEWLIKRSKFQRWRDLETSQVFWLNGNPATGKSFLSGYVLEHLRSLDCDCSSFYFRDGDEFRSTLSRCLLSLAYRMALLQSSVQQLFLDMDADGIHFNKEDYKSIWRQLFVGGILQLDLGNPHYWVIDAVDECRDGYDFGPMLRKLCESRPFRVFVSSRPSLELQSHLQQLHPPAEDHLISPEDTLDDIRSYITSYTKSPLMRRKETRQELVETLVAKSEGCFLWVRLVLSELRKVFTPKETQKILENVPRGMDDLYTRNLHAMSDAPYGRELAKAILIWAICSVRPLTTRELEAALEIYVQDTVDNVKYQIASLCGNFVYVDSQSRVRMVHQTARSFLLSPENKSEFAFSAKHGHRELALTCVEYLMSDEMKAPRNRRPSAAQLAVKRSDFADYATKCIYDHVSRSSSADGDLLVQLYNFLSSPEGYVLSWIESIAKSQDLNHIIKTGAVLKNLVKRRAKHSPALGNEIQIVELWATDLIRIVAKFGHNLLVFPRAIYHLIPPFCPREAAPYRIFGKSSRGMSVSGLTSTSWDDRLACLVYRDSQTTTVACSNSMFAIGASNKTITLYRTATCQVAGKLEHGEYIKVLEFSPSGRFLASAGRRLVCVWDVNLRKQVSRFQSLSACVSMTFTADNKCLLLAGNDNHLYLHDTDSGICLEQEPWYVDIDSQRQIIKAPDAAAFSLHHGLFAFVYRGDHIYIWDWVNSEFVGTCEKPSAKKERLPFHASSMVFNPWKSTSLLAAAYEAGEIIVFDPREGNIVATYKADTDTQTLACSPDGKTLISGDSQGTVRILEFYTLKLLYVMYGHGKHVVALSFCSDNLRFVDIRGSESNIWEPAVLARQAAEEDASDTNSMDVQELPMPEVIEVDEITAVVADFQGKYVFCGTANGLLNVVQSDTKQQSSNLYNHSRGIAIMRLAFDGQRNILASADSSSRTLVHLLTRSATGWELGDLLLDHRMEEAVEQLLFSPDSKQLLIVTTTADTVCDLEKGKTESVHWETRNPGVWACHPHETSQLILFTKERARIYRWDGFKELTAGSGIALEFGILPELELRYVYPAWEGGILVAEYSELKRSRSKVRMILWDTAAIQIYTAVMKPHELLQPFGDILAPLMGTFGTVVGTRGKSILFLDHDGWICSVEMTENLIPAHYKRHFFLPFDWLSTNTRLLLDVTAKGDTIFARRDELAVIKRGLDFVEMVAFERPAVESLRQSSW